MKAGLRVPLYDPDAQYTDELRKEMHAALSEVIDVGYFHGGPQLRAFEESFAEYCSTRYAVGVASGTVALHLSLLALGVGRGDEVITVPNTDIGTTAAISYTGARIVWVDVDESTHNIDPELLESKITEHTKAILPVHLYGLPADLDPILEVARNHDIHVVEDCALALGATYRASPVGSFGIAGCFSFSETKMLGALGSGGMITTDDPGLAEELTRIRSYGEAQDFGVPSSGESMSLEGEGLNVGLGSLQAAFLQRKMKYLGSWIKRREDIAAAYSSELSDLEMRLPTIPEGRSHAFRTYVVGVDHRDLVRDAMYANGIATATHYVPPLHLQPVYSHLGYTEGDFPVTEQLAGRLLCLPIYPEMDDRQVGEVVQTLRNAV